MLSHVTLPVAPAAPASGEEAIELIPSLAPRDPKSAYLFYDCQTDDARLVLTVLGEAERFGAVCANRLEVTGLVEQDGRPDKKVYGLTGAGRAELRAWIAAPATPHSDITGMPIQNRCPVGAAP